MNKRKPKEEKPKTETVTEWANEHPEFMRWWRGHRDSGFVEDPNTGRTYWNTEPWVAHKCSKYRAEFSSDTGSPHSPGDVNGNKIEYSAEEIEQWASDQKAFVDDGGNKLMPVDEFRATIQGAARKMRIAFEARAREAKGDKVGLSAGEINARRSKLANQADAIKAKYEEKT
jgi:hypothetical protein